MLRSAAGVVLLLLLGGCGGNTDGPVPVAVAGNPITANKRTTVTLDGSGSSAPAGLSLVYAWTQTAGAKVVLSSDASPKPTFTAPGTSGTLTFSLVVSAGAASSAASTVSVTVVDRPPVASAPAVMNVAASSLVSLDASASSDPDGDPLSYQWTQVGGANVTLVPGGGGKTFFNAPGAADTLTFTLVVGDGELSSNPVTVAVKVLGPGEVLPPVASAGADQTTPKRKLVRLYGSASGTHGGALTYLWQEVSGDPVTLQGATSTAASFTAPAAAQDLKFNFTVTEAGLSSAPSAVVVHVKNFAPTVSGLKLTPAAPKRNDAISATAVAGDPDGDPLAVTYAWTRNGTAVPQVTGAAYPPGNQAKGEVIAVSVTASDGELSTTASASSTIADSPAILSGAPPSSAPYGTPLTFQLTAADPDGDPVGAFEVELGPAGFAVDASGLVSWTPGGPMFERSVDVSWAVRLKDTPAARAFGTISVLDPSRKPPLVRTNPGIPVGNAAIDVQDFDGAGVAQALIGTYHSVYLLGKIGSTFGQTWAYPFDPGSNASVVAVASGDVDGDGQREIFFASGPFVVKLDGVTRRETARFGAAAASGSTPAGPYCSALRYADLDNDGKAELVCLGGDSSGGGLGRIYVLDAATLQLKWKTAQLNLGSSMAVGNVDGDAALEIVTSGGFVFDGATQQNEWAYGTGFGTVVDIGDVTGDGVGKIVGLNPGVAARVFDAVLKSPIFDVTGTSFSGESALRVVDLDGKPPAEIVVGDGQWGNVTAWRYDSVSKTSKLVSTVSVPGDGVSAIGVGDVDGSGTNSLVFGSDYYSSGRDYLDIVKWNATSTRLWEGPTPAQLDGPFYGGALARLGPSSKRLVFMTPGSDSGYGGMRLLAMDPASGALTVSDTIDSNWSHDSAFSVGDVLGTGADQILLGTAKLYDNYFTAFDLASNTKKWSSTNTNGGGAAIAHADLNKDGIDDFVGITSNGYVQAYDVAHQTVLWGSTGLNGGRDVAVADLDGDGKPEILALSNDTLFVYAAASSTWLQQASFTVSGSQVLVADTNGDGKPEVYVFASSGVGSSGGTIYQLDNTLKLLNSYAVTGATSLSLESSAFGRKNLVVATGGDYFSATPAVVRILDASTGKQVWASPPLLGPVPKGSLSFCDPSGSGTLRLAFGTSFGMYLTQ